MKDEIRKVIEMSRNGKLSDDQAASLLGELLRQQKLADTLTAEHETRSEEFTTHESPARNTASAIAAFVHESIQDAIQGSWNNGSSVLPEDEKANAMQMSQVQSPGGRDYEFRGNHISMSSVSDFKLERSKMNANRIEASKLSDMQLTDSLLTEMRLSASSMHDLQFRGSEMSGGKIAASKCSDFAVHDSKILQSDWNASSIKDFLISEASRWTAVTLNGVSLNDFSSKGTTLQNVQFSAASAQDLTLIRCHWASVIGRHLRWKDLNFTGCRFDDVLFTGAEDRWSLRNRGFFDVLFENCQFSKTLFTDCRFKDVTIRNVTLTDLRVQGVTLSDCSIDGNEAFLAACGINAVQSPA